MVLVYIDESGSPAIEDQEKLFVLTAIIIQEVSYKNIDIKVSNFREQISFKYGIPYNFEFHVKSLLGNKSKKDELSEFKHLSYNDRRDIFENTFKIFKDLEFKFISIAILKNELRSASIKEREIRFWANLFLIERLQMFTQELSENDQAIIFMDNENGAWNQKKLDILKNAIYYHGTHPSYIKIKNIIPTISFLDSKLCMGIQIADIIGYCVRRWLRLTIYDQEAEIDKINDQCFDLIKSKIHKFPDCLQKGLKIFPEFYIEKITKRLM